MKTSHPIIARPRKWSCFPCSSLRGVQRRRNRSTALAAATPFIDLDQRQHLEQGP